MIPPLDQSTGCLPANPKFHDATTEEVGAAFADGFADSQTRPAIFAAYLAHIERWRPLVGQEPREQWMDGSFMTDKLDPGDVDFVTFLPEEVVNQVPQSDRGTLVNLFAGPATPEGDLCHAFVVTVATPGTPQERATERQRRYWERWFGHQRPERGGYAKGIVRLEVGGPL
jgi:hypothetical protein